MNVDRQLAAYFHEQVIQAMAPVVRAPFSAPVLTIDDSIGLVMVSFNGVNLVIQCIFDFREGDVECKVARLVNGAVTPHYSRDHQGRRVRVSLTELLRERGVPGLLLSRVADLPLSDQIRVTLHDLSRLLREYAADILADSASALDQLKFPGEDETGIGAG